MSEFLLEVLSEEMPHSAQSLARRFAGGWLQRALAKKQIVLSEEEIEVFTTPRRLVVFLKNLPSAQPDRVEEKKGPSVNATLTVLRAFLRANGLTTVDECDIAGEEKNPFYVVRKTIVGMPMKDILTQEIPLFLKAIPWEKSMRWLPGDPMTWPRPIRSITAVLDGEILPLEYGPFLAVGSSVGHRFMGGGEPFYVSSIEEYKSSLQDQFVMLQGRKEYIAEQIQALAQKENLTVVENPKLLEEVTDLVEWPVVHMGRIDGRFMELPEEILMLTMGVHQKYFAFRTPQGKLADRFACVANIATDNDALVLSGFERVLKARLFDARFLWEEDKKVSLAARAEKLAGIIFHKKIGTMQKKAERMVSLAEQLAPDMQHLKEAAVICKADLLTHTVKEFPELQGVIGSYLARHEGLPEEVALAIAEHYKPLGPSDRIPTDALGQRLAMVDKLDTLIQFFAIGEEPTSSKDPFALRRMALGIVRLCDEASMTLPISLLQSSLQTFFFERLQVYMLERYDIPKSTTRAYLEGATDLAYMIACIKQLDAFLNSDAGKDVWRIYKRVSHILEQSNGDFIAGEVDAQLLETESEVRLGQHIENQSVSTAESLAELCAPMDAFFETTLVQDIRYAVRQNRLRLLKKVEVIINNILPLRRLKGES